MAPALLFALALLAADPAAAAPDDGPVATAPEARPVRDLAPSTRPPPPAEPASDYELVAWCYGALGAHMGLHDVAMPEVERIERRWAKTPEEADKNVASYDDQHEAGVKTLALFREAMTAAEKASIQPIQEKGLAAIRSGEAIWTGADMADPKRLAREWMSWGLPERCITTAKKLEMDASVLGQAINYNVDDETAAPEDEPAADEAPMDEPADEDAPEAATPETTPPPSSIEDIINEQMG